MVKIKNDLNINSQNRKSIFYINCYINKLLEEKNILNIFITSQNRAYALNITYEDNEHIVHKEQFTILSKNVKQKTDINEPYISLTNNGIIYYIPYIKSKDS